jgi:hypothetical protein
MKTRKLELDVDFIGGQGTLSIAEEKALSEYFRKQKLTSKSKTKTSKQNKAVA